MRWRVCCGLNATLVQPGEEIMTGYRPNVLESRPWDALGLALSLLYVVHCLAMPFVIAWLPWLGLHWLVGEEVHRWLAAGVLVIGGLSFVPGYLRHRRWVIPLLGSVGMLLVSYSAFAAPDRCCGASTEQVETSKSPS